MISQNSTSGNRENAMQKGAIVAALVSSLSISTIAVAGLDCGMGNLAASILAFAAGSGVAAGSGAATRDAIAAGALGTVAGTLCATFPQEIGAAIDGSAVAGSAVAVSSVVSSCSVSDPVAHSLAENNNKPKNREFCCSWL